MGKIVKLLTAAFPSIVANSNLAESKPANVSHFPFSWLLQPAPPLPVETKPCLAVQFEKQQIICGTLHVH